MLRIITHLLHLVTCLRPQREDDDEALMEMRRRIHNIVHVVDPRTTSGDSLLHLSVMKNNTLKSQNLFEDGKFAFFPSVEVTKLLVECGAKINALNASTNSPLHTASQLANYRQEVRFSRKISIQAYVKMSLLDCRNIAGKWSSHRCSKLSRTKTAGFSETGARLQNQSSYVHDLEVHGSLRDHRESIVLQARDSRHTGGVHRSSLNAKK